jgi:hypothetical protein
MKSKPRFIMEYLDANDESPDIYYVIVELVDDVPVNSFIVKSPRPYTHFPFNIYLKN